MGRLLFFLLLLAIGCGPTQSAAPPPATKGGWLLSDVSGRGLVYHHGYVEERSRYHADGKLFFTFIQGKGPPEAPVFYWKIDSDGYLLTDIDERFAKPFKKERLVKRDGQKLVVESNGKEIVLEYLPEEK